MRPTRLPTAPPRHAYREAKTVYNGNSANRWAFFSFYPSPFARFWHIWSRASLVVGNCSSEFSVCRPMMRTTTRSSTRWMETTCLWFPWYDACFTNLGIATQSNIGGRQPVKMTALMEHKLVQCQNNVNACCRNFQARTWAPKKIKTVVYDNG